MARKTRPKRPMSATAAALGLLVVLAVIPAAAAPYVGPEITQLGTEFTDWSGAFVPDVAGWVIEDGAVFTFWGDEWVEYQATLTAGLWAVGIEAINYGDLGDDPWAYPWFELSTNLGADVLRVPASDTEVGHGWVYLEVPADGTYTVRFTWLNDWTQGEDPDGFPILDANIRIERVFFDRVEGFDSGSWRLNPTNGHWYGVAYGEGFSDLETQAAQVGGHLVTIDDQAEQDWLYETFGPDHFLIGINDRVAEGTFQWVSGDPVTYTNWCRGEPNDANEGEDVAVYVHGEQCWNDVPDSGVGLVEVELPSNLYLEPDDFTAATMDLGSSMVVDFDDIDASPLNNSINGREPFAGDFYGDRGFVFSDPNAHPLYVAPGGLFWNESNSLSVARFPFEDDEPPISYSNDDDLGVVLEPSCAAVGFTLVDNASYRLSEYVEFLDGSGTLIARTFLPNDHEPFRAFIGIDSPDRPVAAINIAEDSDDGDDIAYDDFICFPATITIGIDLKPGSYPNSLNIDGHGKIPVAILGSPDFDVAQIEMATLEFAGLPVSMNKRGKVQCSLDDVSGDLTTAAGEPDGYPDLVCHFVDDPDRWNPDNGTATLTGRLLPEYGATPIAGGDSFRPVPPA